MTAPAACTPSSASSTMAWHPTRSATSWFTASSRAPAPRPVVIPLGAIPPRGNAAGTRGPNLRPEAIAQAERDVLGQHVVHELPVALRGLLSHFHGHVAVIGEVDPLEPPVHPGEQVLPGVQQLPSGGVVDEVDL